MLYKVPPQYFQHPPDTTPSYHNIIDYIHSLCCTLHPRDYTVTANPYFSTPSFFTQKIIALKSRDLHSQKDVIEMPQSLFLNFNSLMTAYCCSCCSPWTIVSKKRTFTNKEGKGGQVSGFQPGAITHSTFCWLCSSLRSGVSGEDSPQLSQSRVWKRQT